MSFRKCLDSEQIFNINHKSRSTEVRRGEFSDRFIPRRSQMNMDAANHYLCSAMNSSETRSDYDVFKQIPFSQIHRNYRTVLREAIGPTFNRIYNFNYASKAHRISISARKLTIDKLNIDWPVIPRKKKLLNGHPEIILDVGYRPNFHLEHFMHWGNNNMLAAAFPHSIYIWNDLTMRTVPILNTEEENNVCLRWDGNNSLLAVGTDFSSMHIFDVSSNMKTTIFHCPCYHLKKSCAVTTIVWESSHLVSACSEGTLSVWCSRTFKLRRCFRKIHNGDITLIKFSPDETYLATTGSDTVIRIWLYPMMEEYMTIEFLRPIVTMVWHPWCQAMLAIASKDLDSEHHITIWNVRAGKQTKHYSPNSQACIDFLTWSDISGELVVSYWYPDDLSHNGESTSCSKIVVLSSLKDVVDMAEIPDRVIHMIWNPDGTRLGTFFNNDSIALWDFLGKSLVLKNKMIQSRNSMKKFQNCTSNDPYNIHNTSKSFNKVMR